MNFLAHFFVYFSEFYLFLNRNGSLKQWRRHTGRKDMRDLRMPEATSFNKESTIMKKLVATLSLGLLLPATALA